MRRNLRPLWLLFLFLCVSPVRAGGFTPGDANADGQVRVDDVVSELQKITGLPSGVLSTSNADASPVRPSGVVGDGKLDAGDAVSALRQIVGLSDLAPLQGDGKPELKPAILFEVSTPKATYGVSESVPFEVLLRNNSDEEFTYMASTGCEVALQVTQASDDPVWAAPVCDTPTVPQTLKPGELKTWTYEWKADPRSDVAERSAGPYKVAAYLDWMTAGTSFEVSRFTGQLTYLTGGKLQTSDPAWASLDVGFMAKINGHLPDPGWSYTGTDIEVKGDTVVLTPRMELINGGPVPAVLVPYEADVAVHHLQSGKEYTVIAVGKDTSLTTTYKTGGTLAPSGVQGVAYEGPVASIREPDGPSEVPLADALITLQPAGGGETLAQTRTDSEGKYFLSIEPGKYRLVPLPPNSGDYYPRAEPQEIEVTSGSVLNVDVHYDTGIRF